MLIICFGRYLVIKSMYLLMADECKFYDSLLCFGLGAKKEDVIFRFFVSVKPCLRMILEFV